VSPHEPSDPAAPRRGDPARSDAPTAATNHAIAPPTRAPAGTDSATVILVGLCLLLATTLPRSFRAGRGSIHATPATATVNPNIAPWWELTVLPDIGEVTARAIVAHRADAARTTPNRDGRVFHRSDDLTAVRGIGPITARRIAGELSFGDAMTRVSP
jgi:hypothetical protein